MAGQTLCVVTRGGRKFVQAGEFSDYRIRYEEAEGVIPYLLGKAYSGEYFRYSPYDGDSAPPEMLPIRSHPIFVGKDIIDIGCQSFDVSEVERFARENGIPVPEKRESEAEKGAVTTEIRPGDKVRIMERPLAVRDGEQYVGTRGVVNFVTRDEDANVRHALDGKCYCYRQSQIERIFDEGDQVRVVSVPDGQEGFPWMAETVGKTGRVNGMFKTDRYDVSVSFDDGTARHFYAFKNLVPLRNGESGESETVESPGGESPEEPLFRAGEEVEILAPPNGLPEETGCVGRVGTVMPESPIPSSHYRFSYPIRTEGFEPLYFAESSLRKREKGEDKLETWAVEVEGEETPEARKTLGDLPLRAIVALDGQILVKTELSGAFPADETGDWGIPFFVLDGTEKGQVWKVRATREDFVEMEVTEPIRLRKKG